MNIVAIAPELPATSRMPGSPRLFSLCRELAKRHRMVLASLCSTSERHAAFLRDPDTSRVFDRVEILPAPPAASWWGQQWHRAHLAAHFETRFRQPAYHRLLRETIGDLCRKEKADLVYVDLLVMGQYVDPAWRIPAVIDLHDSMTLMGRRTVQAQRGWRGKLSASLGLWSVMRLERSLSRTFHRVFTNSVVDEAVIKELDPAVHSLTITNGVDMEFFCPDHAAVEPDRLVFTGVMGYHPNEDAALYFCRDILPLIRAKRPQVQFWIVGAEPGDRVRALEAVPGVHVTGAVDDIRPYVRSASVFVCPLRIGSGVKNKILAAMAMEKPTVATGLSMDGLNLREGREVLIGDTPQVFADRVLHLLEDAAEAKRLAQNGLARVRNEYSWAAMGEALEREIASLAMRAEPSSRVA